MIRELKNVHLFMNGAVPEILFLGNSYFKKNENYKNIKSKIKEKYQYFL